MRKSIVCATHSFELMGAPCFINSLTNTIDPFIAARRVNAVDDLTKSRSLCCRSTMSITFGLQSLSNVSR